MTNRLPYYKAYPRDFIEGTIGMSFEEKGAYRLVLDLIYMQSGELPDDARYISGLLGVSVRKWKALRERLVQLGKLQVSGGADEAPTLRSSLIDAWRIRDKRERAIPQAIATAVKSRDGDVCAYCGDTDGPFDIDHIQPWSRGGDHSLENLTVACAPCNRSKGAKTPEEWLQ